MNLRWTFDRMDALETLALYKILNLRNKVFVVEQNCVYLDTDGVDPSVFHLCAWNDDNLVAYARVIPPGIIYPQPSIGRVVSDPAYRRTGIGRQLMEKAIQVTYQRFDSSEIKIGAQRYLENFYTSLGFKKTGEDYIEDGIPHIHMIHRK